MRVPITLDPLVQMGIIQEVVRPLMSGKEAQVYVVVAGGEERVAKVYKDADQRSFKRRVEYTEGRRVRNSRDRRAMEKRSRHGRSQDEAGWRSAEVDVIYRLREAGVCVPAPYNFYEGVLIMDMIKDAQGRPAPRLSDVSFSASEAIAVYDELIQSVIAMLCAGVVHGDLSEFNVLMGAQGPVIIDFPQAVEPAGNSSARKLLLRDVDNLHTFLDRCTTHRWAPYAQEMWSLFERNELTPQTRLRGQFRDKRRKVDTKQVLDSINDAARDEERRRRVRSEQGESSGRRRRRSGANSPEQVQVLVRSAGGRAEVLRPGNADAGRSNSDRRGASKPGQARDAKPARARTSKPSQSRGEQSRNQSRGEQSRNQQGSGQAPQNSRRREGAPDAASKPDSAAPAKKKRRRRRRPRGPKPESESRS